MLNLLIALAVGLLVTLLIKVAGFAIWAGVVPGTLAFIGCYIFLARRIALKVQALSKSAEKELSAQPTNQRERQQRIEKAIKLLEEGLAYERWQFLVGPDNFMAKALHAALFYQRKEYDKMERAFESAVKSGKKEAVVWAAYAWCLGQIKEKEKAMKVMARAVAANPSDEKLKAGLNALQNDKKLRMKAFEPLWWQFGLEQPPLQVQGGGRRVQFQRR